MKTTHRWVVVMALSFVLFLGQKYGWFENPRTLGINQQPGAYSVTQIFDGDTIGITMNGRPEKIRLIGVDTPETHDPRKSVECFGEAATEFTRQLIGSSSVRLEADPLSTNRDRYDRLLRYIYIGERLVNLEIIAQGYGFAYLSFPFTKMGQFRVAEEQARDLSRGLWAACPVKVDAKGFIHSGDAYQ